MGQVTITLNGRTYSLACPDSEEERLHELVDHVRGKMDHLIGEFGQIGQDRLLLMSALLIADDLATKSADESTENEATEPASEDS